MKKNLVQKFSYFLFVLFTLLSVEAVWAQAPEGTWSFFEINAQYRGGVKKGFDSLGCAIAFFPKGGANRQVIMHACVKHPDKKNSYIAFRVNVEYSVQGNQVKTLKTQYSDFEGLDGNHTEQVKDMIIFLGLTRDGSLVDMEKGELNVNGTNLAIQSKFLGKRHEFWVERPGKPPLDGKFFSKVDGEKSLTLDKFHLRRDKISVSFVTAPIEKIKERFLKKAPYDKWVFAK